MHEGKNDLLKDLSFPFEIGRLDQERWPSVDHMPYVRLYRPVIKQCGMNIAGQ